MERRDDPHSVQVEKFSSQPGNRRRRLSHRLGCKRPQAAHDLRTNGRKLLSQEWIARSHFVGLGVPILRGPAFQNVANVDILALEVDGFDDLRQELAGAAHEGQSLLVFVVTGSFADEDEFRIGVTRAENDVCTGWSELTALAVADFGANVVQL